VCPVFDWKSSPFLHLKAFAILIDFKGWIYVQRNHTRHSSQPWELKRRRWCFFCSFEVFVLFWQDCDNATGLYV
jgi:hypothetical protein